MITSWERGKLSECDANVLDVPRRDDPCLASTSRNPPKLGRLRPTDCGVGRRSIASSGSGSVLDETACLRRTGSACPLP
jgi:hypothetical protein